MSENIPTNTKSTISIYLSISIAIVLLDQLTKYLSETYLSYAQFQPVFPGFDLLLIHNSGAAFSFLSEAGGWQRWFLTVISTLISAVVLVWLFRLPKDQKLVAFSLAFILGGALGNLYDRLIFGYVIDFISVYYKDYRFATFNIADSAVSIGAGLMAIDIFKNNAVKSAIKKASDV